MPVTIPGVDLVAAGSWDLSTGRNTFTRADLRHAINASKCPAVGPPIVKIGHVDPRFDGEPAFGSVRNLRLTASGNKLAGDLTGLPDWLGTTMASAYPKRSIEGAYNYVCQIGHTHPFVITGLALLGITTPGVGVLNSVDDLPQMLTATRGDEMDDIDAERFMATHRTIMAAVARGAISVRRALQAARDAADGEYIGYLDDLAGVREFSAAARAVPNLSDMVLNVLAGFEVSAHSHQQALRDAHEALDRGHQANYGPDEFAKMFPPSAPLGSDDDDPDETGPGAFTPGRKRQVSDIQQRAAAGGHVTDEELFIGLYGYRPRPGYFDGE